MAELFRYIQQAYVVPGATRVIDVGRQSDLQNNLRAAIAQHGAPDRIRGIAGEFLTRHLPTGRSTPIRLAASLLAFHRAVSASKGPDVDVDAIASLFDTDVRTLVKSEAFGADKALLDDLLVSVKLTTAFDRINAGDLVAMRQAIALLEDFAEHGLTDGDAVRATLRRPVRIPAALIEPLRPTVADGPLPPPFDSAAEAEARQRDALKTQQAHLKTAYETIMSLRPDQLVLKPSRTGPEGAGAQPDKSDQGAVGAHVSGSATATPGDDRSVVVIRDTVPGYLGDDVRATLAASAIDVTAMPLPQVVAAIKREWQDVSERLAAYQVPSPARVYRVGIHLFAVRDEPLSGSSTRGQLR